MFSAVNYYITFFQKGCYGKAFCLLLHIVYYLKYPLWMSSCPNFFFLLQFLSKPCPSWKQHMTLYISADIEHLKQDYLFDKIDNKKLDRWSDKYPIIKSLLLISFSKMMSRHSFLKTYNTAKLYPETLIVAF